jgi:2-dehydropantoate 2-reductase
MTWRCIPEEEEDMVKDTARILVIGAGVNGSVCAAGLQRAGANVTVLARSQRYAEISEQGIVIENPIKNTRTVTKVPLIPALAPEDVYDYVLVIIRKNQVPDLLPVLAQNRSPNVVFMINNPSGPDVYTAALGRERVLLGFVFAGGKREGSVIRAIGGPDDGVGTTPFGELNGTVTARLKRLVAIFRQAGFKAKISSHMSDYLATHAAMVAPMAGFLMQRGYDPASLKRYTNADLGLLVDGMREVLDVLPAAGFQVSPANMVVLKIIPRFLLAAGLRAALPSKFMEVGAMYHISQAPDEMRQLCIEVMVLIENSGLAVPALRACLRPPDEKIGQS